MQAGRAVKQQITSVGLILRVGICDPFSKRAGRLCVAVVNFLSSGYHYYYINGWRQLLWPTHNAAYWMISSDLLCSEDWAENTDELLVGESNPGLRVTGGDTCHYTNKDCWIISKERWCCSDFDYIVLFLFGGWWQIFCCTGFVLQKTGFWKGLRTYIGNFVFLKFVSNVSYMLKVAPRSLKPHSLVNNSNGKWRCSESKNIVCQNILTSLWWKITET